MPIDDSSALLREANDCLVRGDARGAQDRFRRIAAGGRAGASAWAGLGLSCHRLNDPAGAQAAVEHALSLEPHSFLALILRADLFAGAGETLAAAAHYRGALRHAPPPEQQGPLGAVELRRAQEMCERYAREYETFLRERLVAKGFDPAQSDSRFAQSFDLCLGRKRLYLQQPSQFYFPELPQIQFYERKRFPWMDAVESATEAIVSELKSVMADEAAFRPYVESQPDRPRREDDRMTENRDWTAFYLCKDGEIVEENARRCPETLRALEDVPQCRIAKRAPSILFSKLTPGARIPPHNGFINTRLICHLPLVVPPDCGFRVGNDVREWRKGQAWAFDDTIEHEAWNRSGETRVILIFEIWRPELTGEERSLVATMLEAIDAYRGRHIRWTDG